MDLRLEIVHEDPWGLLEVYEFRRGRSAMVDGELLCPWDGGWSLDGRPVEREAMEFERRGHRYRTRLAPPVRRVPKAEITYQAWWGNAVVLLGVALPVVFAPPRPVMELVELPTRCCCGLVFQPTDPLPVSYEPSDELGPARLRDPGGGDEPPSAPGHMRELGPGRTEGFPLIDPVEGHPLALQIDAAIDERRDDLALCFRASGAAAVRRSGTLLVYGKVFSGGRVTPLFLERDDFDVPALASCVQDVFATIRVPEPPDVVAFHYPIRFST